MNGIPGILLRVWIMMPCVCLTARVGVSITEQVTTEQQQEVQTGNRVPVIPAFVASAPLVISATRALSPQRIGAGAMRVRMPARRPRAVQGLGRGRSEGGVRVFSGFDSGSESNKLGLAGSLEFDHTFRQPVQHPKNEEEDFEVGELVERRDKVTMGGAWKEGYVTQVDPLKVNFGSLGKNAPGYTWDEVRKKAPVFPNAVEPWKEPWSRDVDDDDNAELKFGKQPAIKHVFFDFDQVISRCHVFKTLAGWLKRFKGDTGSPFALTDRGQISKITELNAKGNCWAYNETKGRIYRVDPETSVGEKWTTAALGGAARVEELRSLFADLRAEGVELTIMTKGYVGATSKLLAEEGLLDNFDTVLGNTGEIYGENNYDVSCAPSSFEGGPKNDLRVEKVHVIQHAMQDEELSRRQVVFVEDDPAEIASVRQPPVCRAVFVRKRRGMMSAEMDILRRLAKVKNSPIDLKDLKPEAAAAVPAPSPSTDPFEGEMALADSDNPFEEEMAVAASVYEDFSESTSEKLGAGLHGEVWKTEARDGSGTYAIKMVDTEEPAGFAIATGESRGLEASHDLQMKALALAQNCGGDEACISKWERAASHLVQYAAVGYDSSTIPANFHVVMEYASGMDLETVGDSLTTSQRISVFTQLLEVIQLMSTTELGTDRAWVHRDIKPGNTMVQFSAGGNVNVKVVDLGTIVNDPHSHHNEYFGSQWPWVPPQQRRSKWQFTVCPDGSVSAFDMYSLGVLMIQLHCGTLTRPIERLLANETDMSSEADKKKCVEDFFTTPIGQIVEPLIGPNPCERPAPGSVLEALAALQA